MYMYMHTICPSSLHLKNALKYNRPFNLQPKILKQKRFRFFVSKNCRF